MEKGRGVSVMDHFQDLEDPRVERSKRHGLLDILTIAICAVICGADSWVHVGMKWTPSLGQDRSGIKRESRCSCR